MMMTFCYSLYAKFVCETYEKFFRAKIMYREKTLYLQINMWVLQ